MAIRCLWTPLFFLVMFGIFWGIRGIHEAQIRHLLRRKGMTTDAEVVGHWFTGNAYYVTYRFYHQGQCYKHEEQVDSSKYEVWPRGTVIHISYLPQNPFVIRIAGEGNHYLHWSFVCWAGAVFMVSMVIVLGLPWWM